MDINTIFKRRSIRKFKNIQPPQIDIEKLIKAATYAPSASNKQPWRFHVVLNKDCINAIAAEVEQKRQQLIPQVNEVFRPQFEEYSINFTIFRQAPVLIIPTFRSFPLLTNLFEDPCCHLSTETMKRIEYDSSLMGTACAIQNILLMAETIGLGGCCMTGPLIAVEQLEKMLSIHQGWNIGAIIAVGYPDEEPAIPPRKSASAITKWLL